MIDLSGPAGEGCGPGDCGLAADALRRGAHWRAGRWQVVPPEVPGWNRPAPFVIVVKARRLTTVQGPVRRGSREQGWRMSLELREFVVSVPTGRSLRAASCL
jgi:hypothetical protein